MDGVLTERTAVELIDSIDLDALGVSADISRRSV